MQTDPEIVANATTPPAAGRRATTPRSPKPRFWGFLRPRPERRPRANAGDRTANGIPDATPWEDEQPLHLELFNLDRLSRHAAALAGTHVTSTSRGQDLLLPRLAVNERRLLEAYEQLSAAVHAKKRISPAGEWLLDNFHLIEEQIRISKRHLPRGYSRELPHLVSASSAGYPRVYDIALEVIAHVDGRVDHENISNFVTAYQTVAPLTLGELWAIPIMLRLALIENLRRVATRVIIAMKHRALADTWASRILHASENEPKNLILIAADMARSNPPLSNAFVAEFVQRLQEKGALVDIPLTWIDHQLSESDTSLQQKVQAESQQQAANQVSVGASIGSLRFLGATDWRKFVEATSLVEQQLRRDPAGVYGAMDFFTRDHYRHVIEKLARRCGRAEAEVAAKAVDLAVRMRAAAPGDDRSAHVGYFLIDGGYPQLTAQLPMPAFPPRFFFGHEARWWAIVYFATILTVTAALTAALALHFAAPGALADPETLPGGILLIATAIFAVLCSSQVGVAAANWLATTLKRPRVLPRLDFSKQIPDACRTMVIVPTLLSNRVQVDQLLESLEVRFLGNRAENLHFGLLTDFPDAGAATTPTDAALVDAVREGIDQLNARHKNVRTDRFYLFHRPREWNPHEGVWMGYERKRGKLEALNDLLRGRARRPGGATQAFDLVVGDADVLPTIKYVITLDTDTQLPHDAAHKLVGTIAHPLNKAQYSAEKGRVIHGYGILQPRVAINLPSSRRSWFVRLYAGDSATDPYTMAVSDVYQDLFGEGSFIGKGIYDVDAFTAALATTLPDDLILSHDLIEGCFARSGLVSDVLLYEDHPSHYVDDVRRRRRWIRGDWQIALWLLPRVPRRDGRWHRNSLTWLSRWKIADNLRRSLAPVGSLALLLIGWATLNNPWYVTDVVLGIYVLPQVLTSIVGALRKPGDSRVQPHLAFEVRASLRRLVHAALALVFLPNDATTSLSAIVRSGLRMLVTHKKLLEWRPASEGPPPGAWSIGRFYGAMAAGPLLALAAGAYFLLRQDPGAFRASVGFLGLWFVSPLVAAGLSRILTDEEGALTATQTDYLERLTRKTWRFFEAFVGPDDNWLPPDNFQEFPTPVIAHRTSPTNIGLALLSNLAAYDFGYLSVAGLMQRTAGTLRTLETLERFRGHFYNWYDTQTRKPLIPLYVSTVDSGNLTGHLVTLKAGLAALPAEPILAKRAWRGMRETIAVASATAKGEGNGPSAPTSPGTSTPSDRARAVAAELRELQDRAKDEPTSLRAAQERAHGLQSAFDALVRNSVDDDEDLRYWLEALARQCRESLLEPLLIFAPWSKRTTAPEELQAALRQGAASAEMIELDQQLPEHEGIPSLGDIAALGVRLPPLIDAALAAANAGPAEVAARPWLKELRRAITDAGAAAVAQMNALQALALQAEELSNVEYEFLYDRTRHLLAIGYNVADHRRDSGFYDLLASEARLVSYIAIAHGDLPQDHWFSLGRLLTSWRNEATLLSWSGSMFEYLMPLLVMPTFKGTLLDQTYRTVVQRQIEYGAQSGIPWGVSESGYNATDMQLNYQYRAFGVPGLGFKRGLAEDLVIAPYATVMALMVAPEAACANLERMRDLGFEGRYGFYEAIDYTPDRLSAGQSNAVIRSFMAHHQGMSFLSLAYQLLDQPMQRRFRAEPALQAAELLLHERVPKLAAFYPHAREVSEGAQLIRDQETSLRVVNTPYTPRPEVHLLSNGRYSVMITNAGGGYSRWKDLALTRWREDPTADSWGSFCYVRDVDTGAVWSAAHQPTLKDAEHYEAIFPQARAEFRRRDDGLEMHTEIAVSPEDDVELRRVSITNLTDRERTIELTSYAEVVLAPQVADEVHPAFSNLFVETEIIRAKQAILCVRRPRSDADEIPVLLHLMAVHGATVGEASYETHRRRFVGRGRSVAAPVALDPGGDGRLGGGEGPALDPIVSIRCRIRVAPEQTVIAHIVTGVGETRDAALGLVEKYHDRHFGDRVFELAWTHRQVVLRQLGVSEADAQLYGRLASSVLYANPLRRAKSSTLIKNRRGQASLWGYGISGDLPIILLRIASSDTIDMVRQLVRAHGYWRMMGLAVDLIIWNEDDTGYRQVLQELIMAAISAGNAAQLLDRPGGIFIRRLEQMADEDRILMLTVARAVLTSNGGTLTEQVDRRPRVKTLPPAFVPRLPRAADDEANALAAASLTRIPTDPQTLPSPADALQFANGLGGFSPDGREYRITTSPDEVTPAPWANVLANPFFGTVISESGGAYTWCENAHEFRLTPWQNDALCDTSGEAFYLRDEDTGAFWSPTPLPARATSPYVTSHGFGYSTFKHTSAGIESELTTFVATDAPVKMTMIKVVNRSSRPRRLSVTGYCEWVLGELRNRALLHVTTELDPTNGALLARNPYHAEFGGRIGFFDVSEKVRTVTGDRTEFLGRNGRLAKPAAMMREQLSGRVGAAFDACAAMHAVIELAPGEEKELTFVLGVGRDADDTRTLIRRFGRTAAAREALGEVNDHWRRVLGAVQIQTPDPSIDVLVNGWLPYQVIACRLWARSGYYQSGGAFGFRDQLQDCMALLHTQPRLLREQILRCAARQFREGDVQHWWHPPSGRGVRTHFSDDYLWLPLATCRYVRGIGDTGILDVRAEFLEGRQVKPDEEAYGDLPRGSEESGTLYEHCVRAIHYGLKFGVHGLPLMGCGDWNDGMNLVGEHGKGESVWLAFFLYDVLTQFAPVARGYGDTPFAEKCVQEAARLAGQIESEAWDGEWYRRAYFDTGEPLGSKVNTECQIDSLPQSWAVFSGAGDPARARQAMAAVDGRLVDRQNSLIKLFDPPFDKSTPNPGYIKGYVPGVRENGGQYTHAAIWTAMAFAALGERRQAWELTTMINPLSHTRTPADVETYRVEPYVIAADVYAVTPHTGLGGWTWYTGSAGWMFRLVLESLLGLSVEVDKLTFAPCVPEAWKEFKVRYRYRSSTYDITARAALGTEPKGRVTLDGTVQAGAALQLIDDAEEHTAEVTY